jgi:hypothetical protein
VGSRAKRSMVNYPPAQCCGQGFFASAGATDVIRMGSSQRDSLKRFAAGPRVTGAAADDRLTHNAGFVGERPAVFFSNRKRGPPCGHQRLRLAHGALFHYPFMEESVTWPVMSAYWKSDRSP